MTRREVKIIKRGVVKLELNRSASINFTLRMTAGQRLSLEKIAKKQNRTVTNLINTVLQQYIEEYDRAKK
jgi:hypothetical protein